MLHDVGKIVFDEYFHDGFLEALDLSLEEEIPLIEAELRAIGVDHTEIGTWLGMRWKLPVDLLPVMRSHHDPDSLDLERRELVAVCHVANYVCNSQKIGNSGDAFPLYKEGVWGQLGLAEGDVPEIADQILEASEESEILMSFA